MDPHPDGVDSPAPVRRPRGFAAGNETAASPSAKGGGREREKEKERTKLRERHRRAITSRMLAGLRQYGNFPLPARADMNDVLAALARDAGWVVEPNGTTYRSAATTFPSSRMASLPVKPVEAPVSITGLKNQSIKPSIDGQQPILSVDNSLSPTSLDSVVVGDGDAKDVKYTNSSLLVSADCLDSDELMQEMHSRAQNDFSGTPHIPVYVTLPTGVVNSFCQLVDPASVRQQLQHLKPLQVDGVVVSCWWGIIEGWSPQKYNWSGYRDLFNIIREFKVKMLVVLAFNECIGNGSGDFSITLPKWVLEIGKDNQDIFFTDREGRRNTECLSWGVDKEQILKGRTGIEVYFDFMRSFQTEFDDLLAEGIISAVEIGLGASGELKYLSFSERMGWIYPGIGEFQCYDKYMQQSLRTAAKIRGHSFWARGPDNAGHYNSLPHETGFFTDKGDYDSYYGRFFLNWYAQTLIDHADNVLSLATLAFEEIEIIVKIPAVNWWYKTASHAAELTAGFYNPTNQDGYSAVFEMLKKHSVTMKFVCLGQLTSVQENDQALADSEGLTWQILNSAWDKKLPLAGQNAFLCNELQDYTRLLEISKPRNDPDHRHLSFFVYKLSSSVLTQTERWFQEINYFVRCMHGEVINAYQA